MIYEVNILEEDNSWWVDSRATRYVCKDKSLFKSYESIEDGCVIYMKNLFTAPVKADAQ